MGVNVKVQKSPKPKDIVTAEVRLEQDLKSCMRCRYFYGNNRQCIAKKCVKEQETLSFPVVSVTSRIRQESEKMVTVSLQVTMVADTALFLQT